MFDWADPNSVSVPSFNTPKSNGFTGGSLSSLWDKYGDKITDKGVDIGLSAIQNALGVHEPAPQVAGDGTSYTGGKPAPVIATGGGGGFWDSIGGALGNVITGAGTAYVVAQTNREANKNPPYQIYAMAVLAFAGLYLIIKK